MSFSLNEEQRAFRNMMRGFVDEQIAPNRLTHRRVMTHA